MINEKQLIHLSKFLSLVLRHKPETIGIELDKKGYADVEDLIVKANSHEIKIDRETLNFIVKNNSKKRFSYNETGDRIRASQGHSVNTDLGYTSQKPPEILFHGTSEKSIDAVLKVGLSKQNRQHVHLSTVVETAIKVGQRHGKPVVLEVLAEQMFLDNFEFFISDNGVWLTESVPLKYLSQIKDNSR